MLAILLVLLQTENLLSNGGFESKSADGPVDWKAIAPAEFQKAVEFAVDARDDGRCVRIRNTNPRNRGVSCFAQKVDCTELRGRTLELSCWVKTDQATVADVRIQCLDEGELEFASFGVQRYGAIWGTTPWKRHHARGVVPPRTRQLFVRCLVRGIGEAWFDDVRLHVAKEEERTPAALKDEHVKFRDAASKLVLAGDREAIRAFASWTPESVAAALTGGLGPPPWAAGHRKFGAYDVWIPREAKTSARPLLVVVSGEKDAHKGWVDAGANDLFVARTEKLDDAFLRDIAARLPVDPDRIYATAVAESDRLAGFALFGPCPREAPGAPWWLSSPPVDQAIPPGPAERVHRMHAEPGADGLLIDRGNALDWLVARPRESNPKSVKRASHWLAGEGASGRIEGNVVHVSAAGALVTLRLNPKLVDFAQPVKVIVNGKVAFEGPLASSFDAFVERLAETGDAAEPCWAKLDLRVE